MLTLLYSKLLVVKFVSRYDFNTNSETTLGSHDDAICALEYSPGTGEPPHAAIFNQWRLSLVSVAPFVLHIEHRVVFIETASAEIFEFLKVIVNLYQKKNLQTFSFICGHLEFANTCIFKV